MNDIRDMILDSAGRLFSDRVNRELWQASEDGGFSDDAWHAVAEMGLTRMLLEEDEGGAGLDVADGLSLAELAGYHALPLPLAETFVGMRLVADRIKVSGEEIIVLAGEHNIIDARLEPAGEGWTLIGELQRIAWGRHAHYVLLDLPARDGDMRRVVVKADRLQWRPDVSLAGEARDSASLDSLALTANAVTATNKTGPSITEWGALLRSLQMAGAMRRALELAVEHANERKQFGRPIAKFQAIQQQLAAMAGQVAAAGAAAAAAARATEGEEPGFMIAVAKARVGEAAGMAAAVAHQVHAAMGFTREHTLHYYTRRLWSWRDEFGTEPYWQDRIGQRICATGGDGMWPFLSDL